MLYVWFLIAALVAATLFTWLVIVPHIVAGRRTLALPAQIKTAADNEQPTLKLRLLGYRSIIVGWFGVLALVVPRVFDTFQGYDFGTAFGPKAGSLISIMCMIGAAYFHAIGFRDAAARTPEG